MAKEKSKTVPGKTIRCVIKEGVDQGMAHYHLMLEADFFDSDLSIIDDKAVKDLGEAFLEWCSGGSLVLDGYLTIEVTPK